MTNGTATKRHGADLAGLPIWKRGILRIGDPNLDGTHTIYMSYSNTPIAVVCPQVGPPEERARLAAELAAGLEALDELARIIALVRTQAEHEGGAFASWVMFRLDGFRQALHILDKRRPGRSREQRRRGPNGPRGEPAIEIDAGVDNAGDMVYE